MTTLRRGVNPVIDTTYAAGVLGRPGAHTQRGNGVAPENSSLWPVSATNVADTGQKERSWGSQALQTSRRVGDRVTPMIESRPIALPANRRPLATIGTQEHPYQQWDQQRPPILQLDQRTPEDPRSRQRRPGDRLIDRRAWVGHDLWQLCQAGRR